MGLYSNWIKKYVEKQLIIESEELRKLNMATLSRWLENKNKEFIIFVDQDETLLHLESVPGKSKYTVKNAVIANIMNKDLMIIPRPHVKDFLKECRNMAPTYVLTAGTSAFQEEILNAVGLLDYFNDVFGRDRFHELPKGKNAILIDNLPYHSGNSTAKLEAMGGGLYFKISSWEGTNLKDDALLKMLPEIKKVIV